MPTRPESESAPSQPRIVALAGFMGAGKSSVGRALAALVGWAFRDLDDEIELREKRKIREIFRGHGEAEFRRIENQGLRRVLAETTAPTVISLGGGTFVQPENVGVLNEYGVRVVFLEAPMDLLLQRCQVAMQPAAANIRPLAADADAFRALYAQRLEQYRTADLTVDAAGKSFEQQAQEIALRLGLLPAIPLS